MDDMVWQLEAGQLQLMSWSSTCLVPHSRTCSNSAIDIFLSRWSYSSLTSWYVVVLSPLPLFYLWKSGRYCASRTNLNFQLSRIEFIHLHDLVHHDIKPANFIMGTSHGTTLPPSEATRAEQVV